MTGDVPGMTSSFRLARHVGLASQRLKGVAPPIALIEDERLEHGERAGVAIARTVLDGTVERGRVLKAGLLREEAEDLDLGIYAPLQPTKRLEDQRLVVDEGAVALLGANEASMGRSRIGGVVAHPTAGAERDRTARSG